MRKNTENGSLKKIQEMKIRIREHSYEDPNSFETAFKEVSFFIRNYLKKSIEKQGKKAEIYEDSGTTKIGEAMLPEFKIQETEKKMHYWGENIYYEHYVVKGWVLQHRILKYFKMDISKILPKKKINMRPLFLKYLQENLEKDRFFLLTNNFKHPNILNFPFFFYTCFGKFEELIKVKEENLYSEKTKFCAFIVANENAKDRISFFKKLSKYKKVDSYGSVLNNAKIPFALLKKYKKKEITDEELKNAKNHAYVLSDAFRMNQELFREYKFVICFENSYANDYITEKLPNVMLGNAIGIYRGAGNVGEFFNTKSFLNWDDFGSDEKVIEKIIELDKDDAKYQNMLKAPFFVKNELPPRVKNLEKDLEKFLEKILEK